MSNSLWPHGLQPCQAPLSVGCPGQEYSVQLPFPSPEHLPHPGLESQTLLSNWTTSSVFRKWPPFPPPPLGTLPDFTPFNWRIILMLLSSTGSSYSIAAGLTAPMLTLPPLNAQVSYPEYSWPTTEYQHDTVQEAATGIVTKCLGQDIMESNSYKNWSLEKS